MPSVGRVAVAASPNAVSGPRATLQLGQVTLGLRRTLGSRGEEALAHNGVLTRALSPHAAGGRASTTLPDAGLLTSYHERLLYAKVRREFTGCY